MRRQHIAILLTVLAICVIALSPVADAAKPGNSLNAKSCQKGGWMTLMRSNGTAFTSEEECTSYAAMGGTLLRIPTATPPPTSTNTPTDTPVPPTDTATNTPTDTATNTPTNTPVDTATNTPTNTPVDTATNTPTNTAVPPTSTPTNTPTPSPTPYQVNRQVTAVIFEQCFDTTRGLLLPRRVKVSASGFPLQPGLMVTFTATGDALVATSDIVVANEPAFEGSVDQFSLAEIHAFGGMLQVTAQDQGGIAFAFPPNYIVPPAPGGTPECAP